MPAILVFQSASRVPKSEMESAYHPAVIVDVTIAQIRASRRRCLLEGFAPRTSAVSTGIPCFNASSIPIRREYSVRQFTHVVKCFSILLRLPDGSVSSRYFQPAFFTPRHCSDFDPNIFRLRSYASAGRDAADTSHGKSQTSGGDTRKCPGWVPRLDQGGTWLSSLPAGCCKLPTPPLPK